MYKKIATGLGGAYILYAAGMAVYLFLLADRGIPAAYEGTPADPAVFMTSAQMMTAIEYSRVMAWLYFIIVPLKWLTYAGVLLVVAARGQRMRSTSIQRNHHTSGITAMNTTAEPRKQKSADITTKRPAFFYIKLAAYSIGLSVLVWGVTLPLRGWRHHIAYEYGVSQSGWLAWFSDDLINLAIQTMVMTLSVVVIFALMRHRKHWWLYAGLLAIPFLLFMTYIRPIWIAPLYNDFHPLQDKALKHDIQNLADQANIDINHIYVVNKSTETRTLNAYVNGVGSSLRVVVYDTTLKALDRDELLFVLAHEFGHYKKHHLLWRTLGIIAGTMAGLALLGFIWPWLIRRFGAFFRIQAPHHLRALPLLLLVVALLSFLAQPVELAVSRKAEHAADVYAVELTEHPEAGISFFHKAIPRSLNAMDPPWLVKMMTYSHPSDFERIVYLMGKG